MCLVRQTQPRIDPCYWTVDMGWGDCAPFEQAEEDSEVKEKPTQKVKILITVVQISQAIMDIIEVSWPDNLLSLTLKLGFINLNLPALLKISCWGTSINFWLARRPRDAA